MVQGSHFAVDWVTKFSGKSPSLYPAEMELPAIPGRVFRHPLGPKNPAYALVAPEIFGTFTQFRMPYMQA